MKKVYFQGLNELRALAALSVFVYHVECNKRIYRIPNLFSSSFLKPFMDALGKNGVYVFFVLSGFLITYLLLSEKSAFNKIDLKKFFARRMLRIWPLYYVVILFSFLVIPPAIEYFRFLQTSSYFNMVFKAFWENPYKLFLLYMVLLPNLALKLYPRVIGASQSWSVGVEEQFYLLWPQIIQRVNRKYLLGVFGFIALAPFWSFPVRYLSEEVANGIDFFVALCPFYFMAAGAMGAYALFYHEEKINKVLKSRLLFLGNTIALLFLLFIPQSLLLFAFVVALELLFIIQTNFRFNLRSRLLSKVGDISYGVYMYHPIVLFFIFGLTNMFLPLNTSLWIYNAVVYGVSLVLTLLISHLSFQYFEKRFLALKNKKYSVIRTTEN
ncbi:MAG: acyltransferase [Planctomycetota bacterium]|nr:acyltransferase [Planctomycetota bacterium]